MTNFSCMAIYESQQHPRNPKSLLAIASARSLGGDGVTSQ